MDPVRAANNGATPFSIACNVGAMEVVQTLAADVRVDITQGNRQVRLRVLVLCLAAYALDTHTHGAPQGVTPFAIAAENGRLPVVEFLAEVGIVNVNETNMEGDTPLGVAACTGQLDVVKYLIKRGANASVLNNDGASACWIACFNGHLDLVQFFSSLPEVDLCQSNAQGFSCVYAAALNGHLDVVEFMAEDRTVDVRACPTVGIDQEAKALLAECRARHRKWEGRKTLLELAKMRSQRRATPAARSEDGDGAGFELVQDPAPSVKNDVQAGEAGLAEWTKLSANATIPEEDEADESKHEPYN